jgi:hypothetical protein
MANTAAGSCILKTDAQCISEAVYLFLAKAAIHPLGRFPVRQSFDGDGHASVQWNKWK